MARSLSVCIVAERYWRHLDGVPGVRVFRPAGGVKANYAYLPVLFDPEVFGATRDDVFDALDAANVGARKYFYPLVLISECYCSAWYNIDRTPVAKKAASQVLTRPCMPTWSSRMLTESRCCVGNREAK